LEIERARFEAVLESVSDGFFALDASYRIVVFNAASERFFGCTREAVVGRNVWQAFPAAAHGIYRQNYTRVMETRQALTFEHRSEVRPDRIIEVHATPTPDGGIGVAFRDITDRAAAEASIRATQARFEAAVRASDHLLYEWIIATNELFLSGNVERVLGYTPEEMRGGLSRWVEITHPDDRAAFAAEIDRVIQKGGRFRLDFRVVRKDGSVGEVEDEGYFLSEGTERVMVGFVRDVTARKRAERDREAERQRLATVLRQTPVGIIIAEAPSGRLLSGNDEVARIWRHDFQPSAGVEQYSAYKGYHRTDGHELAPHEWPLARAVTSGEVVINEEIDFLRGDGSRGTMMVNAAPIHDEQGRITAAVVVFTDVSERAVIEQQRTLLINELNHRVKNTLATVQGIASQTLRNAVNLDEARADFESRLLALSRAHDVLTRESWEGASLREIVVEAVAPYRNTHEDRLHLTGPDVRLAPQTALAFAMALQELATNAVKYGALSNQRGEIRIVWDVRPTATAAQLCLRWEERGGPPVVPPSRRGFGTRLIERGLARDIDGEVRMEFAPAGLICMIEALVTKR
jgi:PAS domain S-box-containing protein